MSRQIRYMQPQAQASAVSALNIQALDSDTSICRPMPWLQYPQPPYFQRYTRPKNRSWALRVNGIYAKRIVEDNTSPIDTAVLPEEPPRHVLIIGGTGNLGLEFCHHFAHRGAKRITLVSRSGETAAVANRLQQIRMATTTTIQVNQCDVGDPAAVAQLAEQQQNEPADLIIHAALTYSDIELGRHHRREN